MNRNQSLLGKKSTLCFILIALLFGCKEQSSEQVNGDSAITDRSSTESELECPANVLPMDGGLPKGYPTKIETTRVAITRIHKDGQEFAFEHDYVQKFEEYEGENVKLTDAAVCPKLTLWGQKKHNAARLGGVFDLKKNKVTHFQILRAPAKKASDCENWMHVEGTIAHWNLTKLRPIGFEPIPENLEKKLAISIEGLKETPNATGYEVRTKWRSISERCEGRPVTLGQLKEKQSGNIVHQGYIVDNHNMAGGGTYFYPAVFVLPNGKKVAVRLFRWTNRDQGIARKEMLDFAAID